MLHETEFKSRGYAERIYQIKTLDKCHRHYRNGYRFQVFAWSDDGTEVSNKGFYKTEQEADDRRERLIMEKIS